MAPSEPETGRNRPGEDLRSPQVAQFFYKVSAVAQYLWKSRLSLEGFTCRINYFVDSLFQAPPVKNLKLAKCTVAVTIKSKVTLSSKELLATYIKRKTGMWPVLTLSPVLSLKF
jgi:hypothetical protein